MPPRLASVSLDAYGFQRFFPAERYSVLAREAEPRAYRRSVTPDALLRVFLGAFARRASGLRMIAGESCVGTRNHATLSNALRRESSARFAAAALKEIEPGWSSKTCETLIAVDTTAVTIPASRGRSCARLNDATAGGGALVALCVNEHRSCSPLALLRFDHGNWSDVRALAEGAVCLVPRGPTYLFDRGFYGFRALARLIREEVNFVMRVRTAGLRYGVMEMGKGKFPALDARVMLGGESTRGPRPCVRLIRARARNGSEIVLATNLAWPAAKVLAAYKRRWDIERFFRFVKETVGLAHLYSFQRRGIEFLTYAALIMAALAFMGAGEAKETIARTLEASLRELRKRLRIPLPLRRNTTAPRRGPHKNRKSRKSKDTKC